MPGGSYKGELSPLSEKERHLSFALKRHIEEISGSIGERNIVKHEALLRTKNYITTVWQGNNLSVNVQNFNMPNGLVVSNVETILPGTANKEILVIGAHYDSVRDCPGANDNGSGVAALLELALLLRDYKPKLPIHFVTFVNEEQPTFHTDYMGSFVYARSLHSKGIKVRGMISIETIGYYSNELGSQKYPAPFSLFYPSTGDFIGFVGNLSSGALVRKAIGIFRKQVKFPSEGIAAPAWVPGIGWSDHWAFWQTGTPAIMVTDTAPFRYPHYHLSTDTADKLDYGSVARVVNGLETVIRQISTE